MLKELHTQILCIIITLAFLTFYMLNFDPDLRLPVQYICAQALAGGPTADVYFKFYFWMAVL